MFDIRDFYGKENRKVEVDYKTSIKRITNILNETSDYNENDQKGVYYDLFHLIAKRILYFCELEKQLDDNYFTSKSYDELLKENNEFYNEISNDNYDSSYINPPNSVKIFGENLGQLMSSFYNYFRFYRTFSFTHKVFRMAEANDVFIKAYDYIINAENIEYDQLKKIIIELQSRGEEKVARSYYYWGIEQYSKKFQFYLDIIEKTDLNDLRYLFRYGRYISSNEIRTAQFLQNYPKEKIERLTKGAVAAYLREVKQRKKDDQRNIVTIDYKIGQELIVKELIKQFNNENFECTIRETSSTIVNKQRNFDHRFDSTLWFDEGYVESQKKGIKSGLDKCKPIFTNISGMFFIESFGESPFSPQNKDECLKFTDEQRELAPAFDLYFYELFETYIPRSEISGTMIALPVPEIGETFDQIFEDIIEINLLDNEKYKQIQQKIIEVLDKADFIHIKGKEGNLTNLKVKMQEIGNPYTETNFVNSGAESNIPGFEVFTSPVLKGTNGVLHNESSYLDGLKFTNLTVIFKDGYIEKYSCSNFEKDEENKKYIEENLLFPHKTLPMGEFAIGTNTLAYLVANKHDIHSVLPVLISEKMGPHFAIGDTCFSQEEEHKKFNEFNDKKVVATDNEKSILRKDADRKDEAYTYVHIDIILPYDDIDFITAVLKDGTRIDIIKNGRYVLEGTEELNKPLDNIN